VPTIVVPDTDYGGHAAGRVRARPLCPPYGLLLFVGELDPRLAQVRQCASDLPNVTFFSLPECDHIATSARSELVIPHLKAFLAKVHG
jgi:hypothetical protein